MARTLFTQRQAPAGNQWQEALHAALTAAYPGKVLGVGSYAPTNVITVFMADTTTGDDDNAALQAVAAHDTTVRTDEQIAAVKYTTDFGDVVTRYLNSNLASKTPAQIYTLLQGQVDGWASLADAKAGLREILPLVGAVCQIYLREKLL